MNIKLNEKLIRRNTRLAQIASLSGLLILIAGMVISFTRPEMISYSFLALLVGFLLSQVGIFFTNRYGRRPRPDEILNNALKGFDNKYALYHYLTPASHFLVGPAGLWIILTRHQRGTVTYSRKRWRLRGGGFLQAYLRIFAQENLGRPDLEIMNEINNLQAHLGKLLNQVDIPPINAVLIFTNDSVDIQISEEDDAYAPTLSVAKLKDFLRKKAKTKPISLEIVKEIQDTLNE